MPTKCWLFLMAHPPFALRPKDTTPFSYSGKNGEYLKVSPHLESGMPLFSDLTLLMFAATHIAQTRNQGGCVSAEIKYTLPQFLRFARLLDPMKRPRSTKALISSHAQTQIRLAGATIESNMLSGGQRPDDEISHFLDGAGKPAPGRGAITRCTIRLSPWLFRALLTNSEFLTVDDEYLTFHRRPLAQCILLLLRKYCGSPDRPFPLTNGQWKVPTREFMVLARTRSSLDEFLRLAKGLQFQNYVLSIGRKSTVANVILKAGRNLPKQGT